MSTFELLEAPDTIVPVARRDTTGACPGRRTILQTIAMMWRVWSERRAARRALETVDARTLRDIGIAPELVDYELWRSSWRPLLDWHAIRYVYGVDVPAGRSPFRSRSARDETCQGPRV
jgi:uncharacterized protein YjiS (DUF1127 family)